MEGVRRKGILSFARLTSSLCSLFFALPPSLFPSRKVLETPVMRRLIFGLSEWALIRGWAPIKFSPVSVRKKFILQQNDKLKEQKMTKY